MASPPAVIDDVVERLRRESVAQFVDFGCGRGDVLARIAREFPDTECIGVEADPAALREAQSLVEEQDLPNVRFVEGDVLDHVDVAHDVAYLYLGGALNQRLGSALLARSGCTRILAVRYPVVSATPTATWPGADNTAVFVYRIPEALSLVGWDCPGTQVILPGGTRYLLSRAFRVQSGGYLHLETLSARDGSAERAARIVSSEFGVVPARPGVPIILDLLLEGASSGSTVLELRLKVGDRLLSPLHTLILRTPLDAVRPTELRLESQSDIDDALSRIDEEEEHARPRAR